MLWCVIQRRHLVYNHTNGQLGLKIAISKARWKRFIYRNIASIEHQLDIHVLDLVEAVENKDIAVMDILEGLRYVMDYRIHGGKMPKLDAGVMKRLAGGLLQYTGKCTRNNLILQKPTDEADLAFSLFGDFLVEVEEFRTAVGMISASDLKHSLKLHRRASSRASKEQREACAVVLGILTFRFPQFSDWHELVKDDTHSAMEDLIKEYPLKFSYPARPLAEVLLPPPSLYFDKNAERLAEMYQSSITNGLDETRVEMLRKHYGMNKLPDPPKASILKMIWKQLTDFMIIILIVVAITEAATEELNTAIILFIVVVFNTIVGVVQEYKSHQALEALLTLTVAQASVIRNGVQRTIESKDLVPGDLVVLEEGDAIPADLRLCEVAQLDLMEAILTGESLAVTKSIRTIRTRTRKLPLGDCKGNAFMTTTVTRGRGKGIVVRTGMDSEIGKISAAISSAKEIPSSIERNLSSLGKLLVAISFGLVVVIVLIGIAWKKDVVEMIKVGVSLGVSVIPEGLVAVVTVSMALGVTRMAKKNAIVRKASAVESVGSVTVICSDKTGTLTEGKMGSQEIYTSDNMTYKFTYSTSLDPKLGKLELLESENLGVGLAKFAEDAAKYTRKTRPTKVENSAQSPSKPEELSEVLLAGMMVCALCNNSSVIMDAETETWKPIGDPTEVALTLASNKAGVNRDYFISKLGFEKAGEYAFDRCA